jgi:hypothetical protein
VQDGRVQCGTGSAAMRRVARTPPPPPTRAPDRGEDAPESVRTGRRTRRTPGHLAAFECEGGGARSRSGERSRAADFFSQPERAGAPSPTLSEEAGEGENRDEDEVRPHYQAHLYISVEVSDSEEEGGAGEEDQGAGEQALAAPEPLDPVLPAPVWILCRA